MTGAGVVLGWSRRRMLVIVLALLVVVLAAVALAGFVFAQQQQSTTVASKDDVVGTWTVPGGHGRILLAPDGHFSATGIPDELFSVSPSNPGTVNASGTWSLVGKGGFVALVPTDLPVQPVSDVGLGIVRAGHSPQLCIPSSSPGVLCDVLLRRET
jgi:hypothetical protein